MEESNTKSSSSTSSSSRASHTQFSQWILCAQNNIHAPVTGQQQLHRLFRTFIVDELKLNKIKQKTRNIRWDTSSTKRHVQTNAMRINFIWVMYYGIRADRFTVQFFPHSFSLSFSLFAVAFYFIFDFTNISRLTDMQCTECTGTFQRMSGTAMLHQKFLTMYFHGKSNLPVQQ